jgi:hypothetical protein
VLEHVVSGQLNKQIAAISARGADHQGASGADTEEMRYSRSQNSVRLVERARATQGQ